MPVDVIHTVLGAFYLLVWLLIAQVTMRRRRADSDNFSQPSV